MPNLLNKLTHYVRPRVATRAVPTATPLLPDLLTDAHAVAAGEDRAARLALVVRCCFAVRRLCKNTGHQELGWIAAERARAAAQLAEDPTLLAAAEVYRGFALVSAGVRPRERALSIVTRGAEELAREPLTDDGAEVLGMLHLIAAFAHVSGSRLGPAEDHLAKAVDLAERTGDGNAFGLFFGPTNVGAWQVALAVERGEAGAVAEIAAKVNDSALPPFRRADMLIDVGRGLARERGRQEQAVEAFLRAEVIAAQKVHGDPYAREAVASLLASAGGRQLRGLGHRFGLLSA